MTKIRFTVVAFFISVVLAAASQNTASGPTANPAPAPRAQFFAGTIVELDATHLKIARTLVGHPTESHSFTITSSTKMNKSVVKLRSRVTVRYKHVADTGSDVALEIQPRPVIVHSPKM